MDLSVSKGGICWAEFSLGRGSRGLDVFIRVVPQIEEFIKSLGTGKIDPVEAYGREWFPISTPELFVHRTDKREIEGVGWTLGKVAEPLLTITAREVAGLDNPLDRKLNLSFLKLVGIGSPEGLRFGICGPFSKDFIKEFGQNIVAETRNLVQQYIVPVSINLRISSMDI